MGNHEGCGEDAATSGNCTSWTSGLVHDYLVDIVQPTTGQSAFPYYSVVVYGPWGTAKFIHVAANAWTSAQDTWLTNTLNVPTTYTFAVRHEPFNDTRAPGVTPSESLYELRTLMRAGTLTLSITGHNHLVQLPGGTLPYGDSFGATQPYETILGNAGAPLDAGPYYGYAILTRRASSWRSHRDPGLRSGELGRRDVAAQRGRHQLSLRRQRERNVEREHDAPLDAHRRYARLRVSRALVGCGLHGPPDGCRLRRDLRRGGPVREATRFERAGSVVTDAADLVRPTRPSYDGIGSGRQSCSTCPAWPRHPSSSDRAPFRVQIWGNAVNTHTLLDANGRGAVPVNEARFLWGDGRLYVFFYAGDLDLQAHTTKHDGPVWNDDSVAFTFGDPDGAKRIVQVSISGVVADGICPADAAGLSDSRCDLRWESGVRARTDSDGTLNDIPAIATKSGPSKRRGAPRVARARIERDRNADSILDPSLRDGPRRPAVVRHMGRTPPRERRPRPRRPLTSKPASARSGAAQARPFGPEEPRAAARRGGARPGSGVHPQIPVD